MQPFTDAATRVEPEFISKWKASGGKVVGYTCSYVPGEIFHAAGILPVRLRGIETQGVEIADAYYGPFICSFPKCILQLAGQGAYHFLDGTIITPGCDAMRRLDECWRKAGDDYQGARPDFFYYFDVPHKTEAHGMDWFITEIEHLIEQVESHFGVAISHEALCNSIRLYNQGRKLLNRIEQMRLQDPAPVTGVQMFAATVAGSVMPREDYVEQLSLWLKKIETAAPAEKGKKRLMLLGSISDELPLVELLENETNALVVAENLCFGIRAHGPELPEPEEPVTALARHYLGQSVCPRMYGRYKERLALLKERIDQAGVDGVVMQNIRFCDLHGAENALFERDLEADGIPCLRIEREYGPMTEIGRMKLRINAFLERIA